MCKKKAFAKNLRLKNSIDNGKTDFIAQIIEQPYIMVADKPINLHSGISKRRERTEKANIPSWHYRAVFIPVVKYITKHI